jgi:competence protein ComEC
VRHLREPLLVPLAGLMAGIGLSRFVRFDLRELAAALIGFVSLYLIARSRAGKWVRFVIVAGASIAAGIVIEMARRPASTPQLDAEQGEVVILSGCVVQPTIFARERERFLLELGPGAIASVTANEDPVAASLAYGTKVEIEAKVRSPHNYQNPGSFDYAAYLARQNIFWYASIPKGGAVRVLPGRCGSRLAAAVFALRSAALTRIEQLYAGNDYAIAMMEAILIGESSKLEKIWTDHFRRTGTYHALVISGLHVTVLAGVLLFLLRICMIPELSALFIAAAAAWVYAAVSGWSAPVIRAAGGFTLYLLARFTFRRGKVLNLLAAIAIVYLCWDPRQMFDASFLLSFLSVGALGAIAMPLLEYTSGPYKRAPRYINDRNYDFRLPRESASLRVEVRLLAETVALWARVPERYTLATLSLALRFGLWAYEMFLISAVIQFALALAMILYFHRVSITGLTANLAIVPLMSAVVPLGFAAIFTGWHWLANLAKLLLVASEWVANVHVRFEPDRRVPDPPAWLAVAFALSLILFACALRRKPVWRWTAAGLAASLFALIVWSPFAPELMVRRLELTAVDVGQGDSLLVAFPDGKTMLVDGGGIPTFGKGPKPRIDIGEDVVSTYLWTRRLQHVDVIASTHSHDDHCGGLPALMRNFRPHEFWAGANAGALERTATGLGIKVREPRAGESIPFGGTRIDVLAPSRDYIPGPKPENNDSLVLRIRYGEHVFLLTGDVDHKVEEQMLADARFGPIDVLKVAHHGGRHSTSPAFIETACPKFAVVSAGLGNLFGHPHPDVVRRLADVHAGLYRTDRDGLVKIRSDGHRIRVETYVTRANSFLFLPGFGPD